MRRAPDVEQLRSREGRAQLRLRQLLRIYFDPFSLFKNANTGSLWVQSQALHYNRSVRWMLLAYLRRWAGIGTASIAAIYPMSALAEGAPFMFLPVAGLGLLFSVAVCVVVMISVSYFFLGKK